MKFTLTEAFEYNQNNKLADWIQGFLRAITGTAP